MLQGLSEQLNYLRRALSEKTSQLQEAEKEIKKLQNLLFLCFLDNKCNLLQKGHTSIENTFTISSDISEVVSNKEERKRAAAIRESLVLDKSLVNNTDKTEYCLPYQSVFNNIGMFGEELSKPSISRFIDGMPAVEASKEFEHFITSNVEMNKGCQKRDVLLFIQQRLIGTNVNNVNTTWNTIHLEFEPPGIRSKIDRSLWKMYKKKEKFMRYESLWTTYGGTLHTLSYTMKKRDRYITVAISNKHIIGAGTGRTEESSMKHMKTFISACSTAEFYFVSDPETINHKNISINELSNQHNESSIGVHRRLLYCMFKNLPCLCEDMIPSTLYSTIALFALHVEFHFEHFQNFS